MVLMEIWGKKLGASSPLRTAAESEPGALLHNVSLPGNLPFLRVCQYD